MHIISSLSTHQSTIFDLLQPHIKYDAPFNYLMPFFVNIADQCYLLLPLVPYKTALGKFCNSFRENFRSTRSPRQFHILRSVIGYHCIKCGNVRIWLVIHQLFYLTMIIMFIELQDEVLSKKP